MRPVHVISCGAVTPVGKLAITSAAALRAGVCRLREHPSMVDRAGDPYVVGSCPWIDAMGRFDRLLALARAAITEAIVAVGQPLPRVPAIVATSELPPPEAEPAARMLAARLAELLRPLELDVTVVPQGNAGGLVALQAAMAELERRRHPVCIVAGADSFIDADVLDALDVGSRLACAGNRWGFPPGEAAAALVLASPDVQRGYRLPSMGQLLSVAIGHEPHHARAETPCTGEGLGAVITQALQASGTRGIATTLCDLDGERYRDREYTWATQRIPPGLPLDPTQYQTLVPNIGAVGGATAIVALAAAACWGTRGHHSESDILTWAGSEHGLRGAAVLRTGPDRRWSTP
jgi:3-oxoacyl-[acyl-carrier-protein] synthase I